MSNWFGLTHSGQSSKIAYSISKATNSGMTRYKKLKWSTEWAKIISTAIPNILIRKIAQVTQDNKTRMLVFRDRVGLLNISTYSVATHTKMIPLVLQNNNTFYAKSIGVNALSASILQKAE